MHSGLALCVLWLAAPNTLADTETWEQDLSEDMKIGISLTGYRSVDLVCELGEFHVNVSLAADFAGVVYTRGSFSFEAIESPCFTAKPAVTGEGVYTLRIPFDQCKTQVDAESSQYVNTLIVQHDPELIMPGDAAFALTCSMLRTLSAISVVDPDPSVKAESNHTARDASTRVSFRPRASKDEL